MGTFISPMFYVLTRLFVLSIALHYASFLSSYLHTPIPIPFFDAI